MRWALSLALLCMVACVSPTAQPELAARASAATWEGWEGARPMLPEMDEDRVHTDYFEVRFSDEMEFNKLCHPATATTANGCFRWLLVKHRAMNLFSIEKPVAVVSPRLPEGASVEGLAVHELLHGVVDKTLDRPWEDQYDYWHTDDRVWGRGMTSAENIARVALGMNPAPSRKNQYCTGVIMKDGSLGVMRPGGLR